MSKEWPRVRLGQAIQHRKEFITIDDFTAYKRCRVQLHAKGIVLRDTVQGVEIKTKEQQVCRTNDFLVAEIDAKVGGFGIVPEELDGAIVSSHYFLYTVDETVLDHCFLGYFVRTPGFRDQVSAQGSTNYAAIRPHQVLEYEIPLPPLAEQRRIVARIEELAAKVERARELRRGAVEQANAFVSSLHLKLAENKTSTMSSFLVLDEEREEVTPGGEYPQVGVRGFGQGLFAKEAVNAAQTTYKWFNRLYDGAIVLSQVKGWEGAIAVCPSELSGFYASPEYRTFRCVEGQVIPQYLASVFATPWFWGQLKDVNRGVGARRQRTRPEQFLAMKIPMPAIEYQRQAAKVFKQLEIVKAHQVATAARLEALLPSILDKAFKGEL